MNNNRLHLVLSCVMTCIHLCTSYSFQIYVTVVVDNGTGFVKCGFAGENFPRSIFPSMIGRPILRAEEVLEMGIQLKDIMCGDEAAEVRSALETSYPVENGIVKNWDDMEELWKYTFKEKLSIQPKENKILLTEPPLNPKKNRTQMVETMLEKFEFGATNISIQAMLTLYAQGLLRGQCQFEVQ